VDAQEKYEYWLDTAQYDLETANAMMSSGRWLYVVFMCQQAVEKLAKGLYVLYVDDNVPRIHSIRQIIRAYEDKLPEAVTEERYKLFDDLTAFYIEGRYTDYKNKLSARLNEQDAKTALARTKEAFSWLLTMKP